MSDTKMTSKANDVTPVTDVLGEALEKLASIIWSHVEGVDYGGLPAYLVHLEGHPLRDQILRGIPSIDSLRHARRFIFDGKLDEAVELLREFLTWSPDSFWVERTDELIEVKDLVLKALEHQLLTTKLPDPDQVLANLPEVVQRAIAALNAWSDVQALGEQNTADPSMAVCLQQIASVMSNTAHTISALWLGCNLSPVGTNTT